MHKEHYTKTASQRIGHLSLVLALGVFLPQCAINHQPPPTANQTTSAAAVQKPAEPPQEALDRFNAFLDRV